jgi:uncharacterized protein
VIENARHRDSALLELHAPGGPRFEVHVADRPWKRLVGLALVDRPPDGRGLLIPRCASIHTFGMRFAIDVAFLAWPASRRPTGPIDVLAVRERVVPRRLARLPLRERPAARREVAALELPAGGAADLGVISC